MKKIVINSCYGGFGLSKAVYDELGIKWDGHGYLDNDDLGIVSDKWYSYRADSRLIQAIEKVGIKKAEGGIVSELKIVEIPDDVEWYISEYDGYETVHEKHRSWG